VVEGPKRHIYKNRPLPGNLGVRGGA
jgi:hypothetical protein